MLAVTHNKLICGVRDADDDWRLDQSKRPLDPITGKQRRVYASVEVHPLIDAIARTWGADHHFYCYIVYRDDKPIMRQPRMNKSGLTWAMSEGYTVLAHTLAADLDNEGHAAWGDDKEAIRAAKRIKELVPTACVYVTRGGLRIVQPMARAVPVAEFEEIVLAWRASLAVLGIETDNSCSDWTRCYRLPHVRRDGRPYVSPAVLTEGMVPIEPPEPIEGLDEAPKARAKKGKPRPSEPVGDPSTSPLALAFAAAGWLGRNLGGGKIAVRCPWEHEHTGGTTYDSSTVLFAASSGRARGWWHCSHGHCSHRSQSEVYAALAPEARVHLAIPTPDHPPLAETTAALEDAIRTAGDGVTMVAAQCGLGKTRAARLVAAERAQVPQTGKRAPLHSRTSISVPTHALAREQIAELARAGIPARHVLSVLSVREPDGSPTCAYARAAAALADGGQSVPWILCEGQGKARCVHHDTCRARSEAYGDGAPDARVLVGPHELLSQLEPGKTGLLVIDEPPALVDSHVLTQAEIVAAEAHLAAFAPRYAAAMAPMLRVLGWWARLGPMDQVGPLSRALDMGLDDDLVLEAWEATGEEDPLEAVRAAMPPGYRGTAPPLQRHAIMRCLYDQTWARAIGAASRVLGTVWRALTEDGAVARIESRSGDADDEDSRAIAIVMPRADIRAALARDGATVITDAGARMLRPLVARVIGYEPPLHEFTAPDGAPIERTMLRTRRATRRALTQRGQLAPGKALADLVTGAVEWVLRDPTTRTVGLITIRVVRLAVEAALGRDVSAEWAAARQRKGSLDAVAAPLRPILARLPQPPDLGHYGAIRGLDHWRGHDAVITLGDPWQHLSDVQHESDYLGVEDWEARYLELCQADLEQAQGRLRTVHRTRAGRALHIGAVVPGGWPMEVGVEELRESRPGAGRPDLSELAARMGGVGAMAEAAGVSRSTMARIIAGGQPPSVDVTEAIVRLRSEYDC